VVIGMHRFENGKIAETWTSWDNVAAMTQLGLMPGRPQAQA
jgi:predicted ester cyclase